MPRGGPRPNNGGKRAGAGRKRTVSGAREWWRTVVDDPIRREAIVAAIDGELAIGKTDGYFRAFEHGYGRPPQSLDVNLGNLDKPGQPIEFRCFFEDGQPLPPGPVPVPAETPE